MLFTHPYKSIFFCFFVFVIFWYFLYITMYILNIVSAVKDNDNHKTQNFIYENYYRQIGFPKETVIIQFNENSEEKRFAII